MDNRSEVIRQRLAALRFRLEQVIHAWTVEDYWSLLGFYVEILPVIVPSERCTIFVIELGTERICSIIGTGLQKIRIEPPKDKSIAGRVITTGMPIIANDLDKTYGYHTEVDSRTGFVTRNMVCAPIKSLTGHGVTGAIQVLNRKDKEGFSSEDLARINEVAGFVSLSIESILLNQEILKISGELSREVERIHTGYFRETPFIAESLPMKGVLEQIRLARATPVNVVIQGENDIGKELIARMIHEESNRRDQPFLPVNCALTPEALLEAEFFGYERGAVPGAEWGRRGVFEEAQGGTLFLDEVSEMPMSFQPKFLRAIQDGTGHRLGGSRPIRYDFRIVSTTTKNLKAEVDAGRFREDLFFRLCPMEIRVPPLRERKGDILSMAAVFLEEVSRRFQKKVAGFSPEVLQLIDSYGWPGNIGQLRQEIERMVVLTPEGKPVGLESCSRELIESSAGSIKVGSN